MRPRPPFRLDLTVWALRRREQNTIDTWDGRSYRRALLADGAPLGLAVAQFGSPSAPRLEVALDGPRRTHSVEDAARSALTRLLGLDIDLSAFYARAASDRTLRELVEPYRGLKPPRFPTLFECLLNAVACQQLSLAAGSTLLSRLAASAGHRDPATPCGVPKLGARHEKSAIYRQDVSFGPPDRRQLWQPAARGARRAGRAQP
jgi:DNA-3-methyladenine glycosylase II